MDLINIIMLVIAILGAAIYVVLFIIGFIQGLREPCTEHTYGESLLFPQLDQMDTVYTDMRGTHIGYSKTDHSTGKTTYYDPFGTQVFSKEEW